MAHKHGHTRANKVTHLPLAHLTIRIRETDNSGTTFGIICGEGEEAKLLKPDYTGHIEAERMARQFRDLAKEMDRLAAKKVMADG